MPLTAITASKAKPKEKAYKLSDAKGLYLHVMPKGAKYWRMKYRFAGKEKVLALGVFPEITLAEARAKRDDARKQLNNGIDPGEAKRAEKAAQGEVAQNSFEMVAREWYNVKPATTFPGHNDRTWRALEKDLFLVVGKCPIGVITQPELLAVEPGDREFKKQIF